MAHGYYNIKKLRVEFEKKVKLVEKVESYRKKGFTVRAIAAKMKRSIGYISEIMTDNQMK